MSARPEPLPLPPEPSSPALVPVHAAFDNLKRILLVDDEAHVLRVMRLSLDRNGYEVDTALDGEVALRMLGERRYAVMITGAELAPNGRGLCDSVRERLGERAPLMLVMSDAEASGGTGSPLGDCPPGVEPVERPVSLRWIVARLNEYFGDYDVR